MINRRNRTSSEWRRRPIATLTIVVLMVLGALSISGGGAGGHTGDGVLISDAQTSTPVTPNGGGAGGYTGG